MTTTYLAIQAPNDLYYVITRCGVVAVNGTLETFDNLTGLPKPTYRDPFKQTANPTKIKLGSNGSPGFPIYWDTLTSLYKIVVRDASGTIIDENDNYPILTQSTSSGPINLTLDATNFSLNPQFYFWSDETTYTNDMLPVGSTPIADEWYFTRSNTTADITISQQFFPAGDTSAPGTPPTYLLYTVNTASADASSDIGQRYQNVQTLNNTIVTESMYFQSALIGDTATVDLLVRQVFGTGGSTTVETPVDSFVIDDTMQVFSSTFTVPTIAGLTIGDGSYLEIFWRLNPAQTQSVKIADNRFQKGVGTGILYPYQPLDQQQAVILPYNLEQYGPNQGTNIIASPAGPTPQEGPTLFNYLEYQPQPSALVGWYFPSNPNQMGSPNTSTDTYPNVHGGYIADMTILQSDGDNIVNKTSFIGNTLNLEVVTPSKKFGIGQILDPAITDGLYDNHVSAFFTASSATLTGTMKFAIVGWNGTAGQEKRSIAIPGAWGAAGTNPTLETGWNYIAVGDYSLASTDFGTITAADIPIDTYTSLAVFWWYDDLDAAATDVINFYYANLTKTGIPCKNVILEDPQTTLNKCQRFFYKTFNVQSQDAVSENMGECLIYPIATTVGFGGAVAQSFPANPGVFLNPATFSRGSGESIAIWAAVNSYYVEFPQYMLKAPTITVYNPNDLSIGNAYNYCPFTAIEYSLFSNGFNNLPLTLAASTNKMALFTSEQAFIQLNSTPSVEVTFEAPVTTNFNIIADAQLGV